MGHKMLILGAGMIAKAIAYDFDKQEDISDIVIADKDIENADRIQRFLKSRKTTSAVKLDVINSSAAVELMKGFDCAVSCVPYQFNYVLAKAAADAGCNFIDLGGNDNIVELEFSLDKYAKERDVTIIPGCGLAPGLVSNLTELGLREIKAETVRLRVGGLPQNPKLPLNYMIVFSVKGLLNEYIEPSVIIENGKVKKVESMTGLEEMYFSGFGRMEAFYTSGGILTMPGSFKGRIKNLDYKTIRYPGHCAVMKDLLKTNTRQELEEKLEYVCSYEDEDAVLLRVELEGEGRKLTYELTDYEKDGLTAMMRCTGFPAAVIAEMTARGDIKKKGILKQECDIPNDILYDELCRRDLMIVKAT